MLIVMSLCAPRWISTLPKMSNEANTQPTNPPEESTEKNHVLDEIKNFSDKHGREWLLPVILANLSARVNTLCDLHKELIDTTKAIYGDYLAREQKKLPTIPGFDRNLKI